MVHSIQKYPFQIVINIRYINSLVRCRVQNKRITPLSVFHGKATKDLIAFAPKIDCDQTAIGYHLSYHVCSITHS
jgi:hypothetical protein